MENRDFLNNMNNLLISKDFLRKILPFHMFEFIINNPRKQIPSALPVILPNRLNEALKKPRKENNEAWNYTIRNERF